MRETLALVRAAWLSRTSYRLRTLLGLGGLLVSIVPLYFITDALQPIMAEPISAEARQYFGFVVIGTTALSFVDGAVRTLPGGIGGGIQTGTFEALLSTPAPLPAILAGMMTSSLIWTGIRSLVLLTACWALGGGIQPTAVLPAMAILMLVVLSYVPFGLVAAALVLMFRTTGPLPRGITYLSALLGGVYYPTQIIPSWIQYVSEVIPLTYGLRALRKVFLEGGSLWSVAADLTILIGITVGLFAVAIFVFSAAFRYAKRAGTLAQY